MFYEEQVADILALTEATQEVKTGSVAEALTLVETASASAGTFAEDELNINEQVSTAGSQYSCTVNDSLSLVERPLGGVYKPCANGYVAVPPLGFRAYTTLSYPFDTPVYTVDLRNPEFGNKQTQDSGSIQRMSRGGEQIAGRESTWITLQYLELSFTALTTAQRDDLIELLEASAGDEIKLIDWENRTWKGYIVSEPNEILQMKDDGVNYEVKFKFEGVLQV